MINFIQPIKEIHNGMLKDVPNKSPFKKIPFIFTYHIEHTSRLGFLVIIINKGAFFVYETFEAITLQSNP
jgi:hypothetical protein